MKFTVKAKVNLRKTWGIKPTERVKPARNIYTRKNNKKIVDNLTVSSPLTVGFRRFFEEEEEFD